MRRHALALSAVLLLAGASSLVADDRVNLWPLYYRNGSYFNVAWPLTGFDGDEWHVGPIFRNGSDWGVLPFFMDFDDTIVVTPFVIPKRGGGGAILPFVFMDWRGDDTFWTVFPLAYRHVADDDSTTWAAAGLVGRKVNDGVTESLWLHPLFYLRPRDRFGVLGCGLAGWAYGDEDDPVDWVLPFYWRDSDTFLSIPWSCGRDRDGKLTGWFSLPLLSWCRGDSLHITPLVGWTEDSSWFAPFYYHHRDGTFCTLLGGRTPKSSWVAPLWYRDQECFLTLPYGRIDYGGGTTTNRWWGLPIFQTKSGVSHGFGIHPLVSYSRDSLMDAREREIDSDRMTFDADSIGFDGYQVGESLEWLMGLAGTEHNIFTYRKRQKDGGDEIVFHESNETGNLFTYKSRRFRAVSFDTVSGARHETSVRCSRRLFGWLWHHEWKYEHGKPVRSEITALYGIWNQISTPDGTRLRVLPWFRRETHADGSSETSFLWRLFRYDFSPNGGTELDLLFIPVMR